MASEDESQALDTHHDEKDWEAQKENFRKCYIDDNMTRKDAAQHMKDYYNFDATPRQWERKIKLWGFTKYSSRDERLQQIAQTGKSIYDIGRTGRRPRSRTDERGNLHPHPAEDRNLRRFARREVRRSRSRSRSQSFTSTSHPYVEDEHQHGSSNAVTDQTYNLKLSNPALLHPPSSGGFNIAATPASGEQDDPIQLHYLREERSDASSEANEPDIVLTVDDGEGWPQAQLPDIPAQFDLTGEQDQFSAFSEDLLSTHDSVGSELHNQNLQYALGGDDASFNYPIANQTMSSSVGFDPFVVSGNSIGINPGILSDNMLAGQQMFANATQFQQAPNVAGSSNLGTLPVFTFEVVDSDSTTMGPPTETTPFPDLPIMPESDPDLPLTMNGPLHNDVMPLLEEYTRAVQNEVQWTLSHQQYGDQVGDRLAERLEQPAQVFRARMAVVLDNFAAAQQRAFQSMRETCSKLRQKNTLLEGMVNEGMRSGSGAPPGTGLHRSSLPAQASIYNSAYSNNY